MNQPIEQRGITTAEVVVFAKHLSQKLRDDQIVSDDIKQLAWIVGLLADWVQEAEGVLTAMSGDIDTLAKRPVRNVTINYGK